MNSEQFRMAMAVMMTGFLVRKFDGPSLCTDETTRGLLAKLAVTLVDGIVEECNSTLPPMSGNAEPPPGPLNTIVP